MRHIAIVCGCSKVVETIVREGAFERIEIAGLCTVCEQNDKLGKGYDHSPHWPFDKWGKLKRKFKVA